MTEEKQVPWFLQPFQAVWQFARRISAFTGQIELFLGLILLAVGGFVILRVIGLIVNVPLIILLFIRT